MQRLHPAGAFSFAFTFTHEVPSRPYADGCSGERFHLHAAPAPDRGRGRCAQTSPMMDAVIDAHMATPYRLTD
jgi:hypothetical protein